MSTISPRITARVDLETQALLAEAAAIAGMSGINSFVVSAAVEKAKTIIEQDRQLKLSVQDTQLLLDALDCPAKTIPRLAQAAESYDSTTQK